MTDLTCKCAKPNLYKIWDKMKYAPHQWGDIEVHNENVEKNRNLCDRCDGTGNELFSMYRKCSDCGGTGFLEKKE